MYLLKGDVLGFSGSLMERRESLSGRGVAWENEVAAVRGGRLCVAESKNGGHALETPLSAVSQGDNLVTP
jgi:hypothetical protein